jgi:DNA-binding GntR family transcriptional regulator
MTRERSRTKVSWESIANSVIRAILERRLAPGTRIGEEELSAVFHVSRTIVRQALTQLASQGIVVVRPKKGWFVVEPTSQEVQQVFATRRMIQGAFMREFVTGVTPDQIRSLWEHLRLQRKAIAENDVARRTYLLNDFDVEMARMTGNELMTRIMADLAMRTTLASMLFQGTQKASASADEHERIIQAVENRDADEAARITEEHLRNVETGLQERKSLDPVCRLRETLAWSPAVADAPGPRREASVRRGAVTRS